MGLGGRRSEIDDERWLWEAGNLRSMAREVVGSSYMMNLQINVNSYMMNLQIDRRKMRG